jgi:hypothetical protein
MLRVTMNVDFRVILSKIRASSFSIWLKASFAIFSDSSCVNIWTGALESSA